MILSTNSRLSKLNIHYSKAQWTWKYISSMQRSQQLAANKFLSATDKYCKVETLQYLKGNKADLDIVKESDY